MHQFKECGFPEERGPNLQRRRHLDAMQRVRAEQPFKTMDWGAPMLSIPLLDWAVLKKRFPDLISPDFEIHKRAWNKFLRSEASTPYRVKDKIWRPITAS